MARQSGHIFITGTIDDITYYKMDGIYYARMKSSLSRKKVLTSPRFALTRMHAGQLAEASRIASQLYRTIPKEKRNRPLFRSIVGKAKLLLARGNKRELVLEIVTNELFAKQKVTAPKQIKKKKKEERPYISKKGKLVWKTYPLNHPVFSFHSEGRGGFESPFLYLFDSKHIIQFDKRKFLVQAESS